MSFFYFFLIIGSVIVYLILRFDKQQQRKQKMLLKQTSDVQPLLLMQSLGQKLNRLNETLVQNAAKNEINAQLKKLTADYNCGQINIQVYNNRLSELLKRVEGRG